MTQTSKLSSTIPCWSSAMTLKWSLHFSCLQYKVWKQLWEQNQSNCMHLHTNSCVKLGMVMLLLYLLVGWTNHPRFRVLSVDAPPSGGAYLVTQDGHGPSLETPKISTKKSCFKIWVVVRGSPIQRCLTKRCNNSYVICIK